MFYRRPEIHRHRANLNLRTQLLWSMNRRVVVTGLGAITPIGNNVPEFWSAVKQQKVGISAGVIFAYLGVIAAAAPRVLDKLGIKIGNK